MNKNKSNKLKGIVVALKANFLIVEIDHKNFKDAELMETIEVEILGKMGIDSPYIG